MSGTGGCGHDAGPGRSGAVHHVDGGDFALRLQERAAHLRDVQGGGFGDLAGRSDGIPVEGAASGEDRALHDGDIAFTELPHGRLLAARLSQLEAAHARRYTVMAPGSGQQ